MLRWKQRRWLAAVVLLIAACSAESSSIVIHETPLVTVRLNVDSGSKLEHSHPFSIDAATIERVLNGLQVEARDTITGTGVLGSSQGRPVFTPPQIASLAPYFVTALKKASPRELATFYMVVPDENRQRSITSGGLFVQDNHLLHITLANCRSVSSGGQDYTIAMELDTRDEPLLPVSPFRFRIGFHPVEAWLKTSHAEDRPSFPAYGSAYTDPAKSVVIDLNRLK